MKSRALVALLALLALLVAAPAHADDDDHKPKPTTMIVVGSLALGSAYTVGVLVTANVDASGNHTYDALYVPVVGPFITAVQSFAAVGHSTGYFAGLNDLADDILGVIFIVDGVAQLLGAIEIGVGIARLPKKPAKTNAATLHVTPVVGRSMTGISASLAF